MSPHHPITPSPHHSITPSPHHSITPSPHHPITPSPHRLRSRSRFTPQHLHSSPLTTLTPLPRRSFSPQVKFLTDEDESNFDDGNPWLGVCTKCLGGQGSQEEFQVRDFDTLEYAYVKSHQLIIEPHVRETCTLPFHHSPVLTLPFHHSPVLRHPPLLIADRLPLVSTNHEPISTTLNPSLT